MNIFVYTQNGCQIVDAKDIATEDELYFTRNEIRVSIEHLDGIGIIAYGCPFSDKSEESEVIVFANGRDITETMAELAQECKGTFGETFTVLVTDEGDPDFEELANWAEENVSDYLGYNVQDVSDNSGQWDNIARYKFSSAVGAEVFREHTDKQ